jgi:hypothetical protein
MNKQINPDNSLQFVNQYGRVIDYYDDGFGPLWIFQNSMGIERIIRSRTWEDAYSIAVDERAPISEDRVHEAYGLNSQAELDAADKETVELIEGYEYQSNATGTGIVDVDLNGEQLSPLTYEMLKEMEITMSFTEEDK